MPMSIPNKWPPIKQCFIFPKQERINLIHFILLFWILSLRQIYFNQRMQVITDPETYETSEIVEKSNKSGIFSNKRLLVIKSGFLYYFTNVPKNYKAHVPNILTAVKELPKSSIEIKTISVIKMESSNSPNLIIKFYERDMIQRQAIRNSISNKNYRHTKKNTSEQEEWKFTFSSVLNCRLWYTALLKLSSYFSKKQDKIEEFFTNFDPSKRNSQLPPGMKDKVQNSNDRSKTQMDQNFDIVAQFIEEDQKAEKRGNVVEKKSQINKITKEQEKKPLQHPPKPIQLPAPNSNPKPVQLPNSQGTPPKPMQLPGNQGSSNNQLSPPKQANSPQPNDRKEEILESSMRNSTLEIIQEDEEIKSKHLEEELRQEIEEQIRTEEKKKSQKIIQEMKKQLTHKADLIKQMEDTIKNLEYEEKEKERKLQETEKLLTLNKKVSDREQREQSRSLHHSTKKKSFIEMQEFSMQTDEEGEEGENLQLNRTKNISFIEDLASTQRDTFNWIRNTTGSFSFQLEEKDRVYENYDYYTEVGNLSYCESFEEKVRNEVKLINYISKMKNIALETLRDYIEREKPLKTMNYRGTLFEISVACSTGKIVNIEGKQKLVYSNKEHQRLKREFKVYNVLQDQFINLSKKKRKFPLRVPLCFLVEYKGYTALLKYLPYLKELPGGEQDFQKIQKILSKIVEEEHLDKFEYSLIANRSDNLFMVTILHPYKITKDLPSLKLELNSLYGSEVVEKHRIRNYSTNSEVIENQIKNMTKSTLTNPTKEEARIIQSLKQILFCRNLKNLYRSTEPFSQDLPENQKSANFFVGFMSSPLEIAELVSDDGEITINGLLINHLQRFLGMRVASDFNIYETPLEKMDIEFHPIVRSFSFCSLYPNKLNENLEKYISSGKYDLANAAFEVLEHLEQQNYQVQFLRVKYEMKKSPSHDHDTAKKAINVLQNIKESIDKHHGLQFQCSMLLIQCLNRLEKYSDALNEINWTIEYIQYMFSPHLCQGETEEILYLLVAETLSKMNNHQASMEVYRKLLQNKDGCLSQEQISMSIARTFSEDTQTEPAQIIEFLLSFIKDPDNLTKSRIGGISSEWQAEIRQLIGSLYLRMSNTDHSIRYLDEAVHYYEENGVKSEESLRKVMEICLSLFSAYKIKREQSRIFSIFKQIIEKTSISENLNLQTKSVNFKFVTACFCRTLKTLTGEQRKTLSEVLEQFRDHTISRPEAMSLITFEDLERTVTKLANHELIENRELQVLEQVDIAEVQIYNISSAE